MANRNFRSDERDFGGQDHERHRRGGGSEGYRSQQGQYRNEDDNWWGRRSSFEGGPGVDDEFEQSTYGHGSGRYGWPSQDRQQHWQQYGREDLGGGRRQFGGPQDSPEFSQRYGQSGYGVSNRDLYSQQGNSSGYGYGDGDGNRNRNRNRNRGQYSQQGGTAGDGHSGGYGSSYGQGRSRYNPSSGQMGANSGGYAGSGVGGYEGYRSGAMGDHSRRGPKNYQRSDERLKEDICDRLLHDVDVDASDVSVEVKGGKVMLEGSVPERYMKHTIEDIADACYGVKEVDNKVRVSLQSGLTAGSGSQNTTSNSDAAAGRLK